MGAQSRDLHRNVSNSEVSFLYSDSIWITYISRFSGVVELLSNLGIPHSCDYVIATDHSLHFVRGCSHRHHLASDFDSHEWTAVKSVCGRGSTAYAHAYTMKHCRCGSLERTCGRANGTAKFIQRKLCRQLSAKFKFRKIKVLYGS